MGISLLVTRGNNRGKGLSLVGEKLSIGRDIANSFTVDDQEVSRFHCHILNRLDGFWIIDNDSSNGTFVNGDRVKQTRITPGDTIRVGQTTFLFRSETETPFGDHDPAEETNAIAEQKNDTLVMSLREPSEFDEKTSITEGEGREFVQIQNDLRFLHRATRATSRSGGKLTMLGELLDLTFDWIAADRGCVFLRDEETDIYKIELIKSRRKLDAPPFEVCRPVVDYVIDQKVGVLSHNPGKDFADGEAEHADIGEIMCVPIQAHGLLLGMFYVDSMIDDSSKRIERFKKEHLRLMLSVAHQAAIVMENESYISALIEQEKLAAVGETTALLSHRINNILQGINGGRHLLESGLEKQDWEMAANGWAIVERNQSRVSQLILDLVFLSQTYEPKPNPIDFVELLDTAISKKKSISTESIVVHSTVNKKKIGCTLDADQIQKSLQDLIQLCADACHTEPVVSITLDSDDDQVFLQFEYEGAEIVSNPKDLDNPSFDSTTHQFGGIELALSKKIISGHGGTFDVTEKNVGSFQISVAIPRSILSSSPTTFH